MTPEWKLFINFCPNSAFHPRFTCRGQIWRKSAVAKLLKSRLVLLTEKRRVRDTFYPPPISPHLPDRAQNFVNVVDPGPVNVYRLWSGSDAVCRTYSGKSQKSQYNIDFQPIQQEVWPPGSADTVWPCSPASNDAGTAFRFPDLEEAEVIRTDDVRL